MFIRFCFCSLHAPQSGVQSDRYDSSSPCVRLQRRQLGHTGHAARVSAGPSDADRIADAHQLVELYARRSARRVWLRQQWFGASVTVASTFDDGQWCVPCRYVFGYVCMILVRSTANVILFLQWPAPAGCTQYYPNVTGTVSSFNFDDPDVANHQYLPNLNYAICFNQPNNEQLR